ncbi:hypothetical protein [Flagellimonas zhangzhouensis]|uniref:Membrane metalloprotease n=1 Tax=Flagellimonas zhangzhouensis TaxID=1073328 RepID=A0A1H2Q9H0_9FLAO|nr:hypothetical protein [Allomuricauda zhangzhouensis]SDQ50399.1 hypothetical protein SAMN05216294_1482 [Allomuricauda zhangzhouensis]SDW03801.1 hypothetical protein SAMN04487892_0133 [Allomuricauda zhangzhouensis]
MKKKIAFTLLSGLLMLFSCSKDSEVTPSGSNATIDKSGNRLSTGASARDLLSNADYDKLLIEIDYVTGFAPTAEAIANFEEFLLARTFKQTIEFKYTSLASPNEETLTLEEIVDLETENRDEFNDGTTLAIHLYFADAPADSDNDEEGLVTLGAVYRNTSMVIYESTVQQMGNNSSAVTVSDVETATLLHEFGHLFGLVNLSTTSVNEHEDPDAENHCNVEGCLMRAELQFGTSLLKQMESRASKGLASIPDFDAECLLDLQKYGGR